MDEKLKDFLINAPQEKISKLIERLEATKDPELIEYAEFLRSLIQ